MAKRKYTKIKSNRKIDNDDLRKGARHEFEFINGPLKGTYYSRREHSYWCLPDVPRSQLFPLTESIKTAKQFVVYSNAKQGRSKHKKGHFFSLRAVVQIPKAEDWLFNTHGIVAAAKSSIVRGDFDFFESPY